MYLPMLSNKEVKVPGTYTVNLTFNTIMNNQ